MCLEALSIHSRLRHRHPAEGLALGGGAMLLALMLDTWGVLAILALGMLLLTVLLARPPLRLYVPLALGMLPFLALSSLALVITLDGGHVYITQQALLPAFTIALRAFTCGLCSLFLAFAHPPESWIYLIGRAPLPRDLIDLLSYSLKAVFILVDRAWHMHLAQQSRLGYSSWRSSLRSTALLAANLWNQTYADIRFWHIGISARAGSGTLHTLSFLPPPSSALLLGSGAVYAAAFLMITRLLPGAGG